MAGDRAQVDARVPSRPRVLSIAGTDPTGGAGIQADLKAFAAHGAYGMAVVTAVVAQNTQGVRSVHVPGVEVLVAQLDAVSDDVTLDAVKVGMLGSGENAAAVGAWLDRVRPPHVVLDPVMVASSGHQLLDADGEGAVLDLVRRVDLVTPNLAELAVLVGEPEARSWDEAVAQGSRLTTRTGAAVLVTGGHLEGPRSPDALVEPRDGAPSVVVLDGSRVETPHTHGTGCSLSSAVAALRPRRGGWEPAVREAKAWLTEALVAGRDLAVGRGRGPLDHLVGLAPRQVADPGIASAHS